MTWKHLAYTFRNMDLILWRHADAHPGEADLERALTGKGRRQAASMAAWLEKNLPDSAKIIVSPAVRTIETANALDRKFKIIPELAPGAQPASLLSAAGWPDNRHPVVIVGHQPALGQLASLLLFGMEQEMSMRKGAVWWLTNRSREDGHKTTLRAVLCPDYL
jgi:phosphohistidine phosphatase